MSEPHGLSLQDSHLFWVYRSCYRYYLDFTGNLQTLFDDWHMGQKGPSAYRPQFCEFVMQQYPLWSCLATGTRSLVTEFCYGKDVSLSWNIIHHWPYFTVWIAMIIISMFKDPALRIAQHWWSMHHRVEATDLHEQTLNQSRSLMILLSENLCYMIMVLVTSILAPLLLLIAVPWSWMNVCSLAWVEESERAAFGPSIAKNVIVHAPLRVFRALTHTGNMLVSIFVFVDLQVYSPFVTE